VGHVTLSLDGARLAYCAETLPNRHVVVVDDRAGPPFDRLTRPVFSPDGRVVAYGARKGSAWVVMAGTREMRATGEVASVFLSADGREVGWIVTDGSRVFLESERGRGDGYDWIGWPMFRADGTAIHFASRGSEKYLISGSRQQSLGDCVLWDPDIHGDSLAYSARIARGLWRRTVPLP
jgi:hypothetical protein